RRGLGVLDRDAPGGPSVGQLLTAAGGVRDSTPPGLKPLLDGGALRRVLAGRIDLRSGRIPGLESEWRIRAVPVRSSGRPAVVIVATSLDQRDEALDRL